MFNTQFSETMGMLPEDVLKASIVGRSVFSNWFELWVVPQPQVKHNAYHMALLSCQQIQVCVVGRTNTTSNKVP